MRGLHSCSHSPLLQATLRTGCRGGPGFSAPASPRKWGQRQGSCVGQGEHQEERQPQLHEPRPGSGGTRPGAARMPVAAKGRSARAPLPPGSCGAFEAAPGPRAPLQLSSPASVRAAHRAQGGRCGPGLAACTTPSLPAPGGAGARRAFEPQAAGGVSSCPPARLPACKARRGHQGGCPAGWRGWGWAPWAHLSATFSPSQSPGRTLLRGDSAPLLP